MVEVQIASERSEASQVPARVVAAVRPMADLDEHMRRIVADLRKKYGDEAIVGPTGTLRRHGIEPTTLDKTTGQGGRPRYTDAYRARVAADYVDACQQAPGRPIAWLVEQEALAGRVVEARFIRDQVRRARVDGLFYGTLWAVHVEPAAISHR